MLVPGCGPIILLHLTHLLPPVGFLYVPGDPNYILYFVSGNLVCICIIIYFYIFFFCVAYFHLIHTYVFLVPYAEIYYILSFVILNMGLACFHPIYTSQNKIEQQFLVGPIRTITVTPFFGTRPIGAIFSPVCIVFSTA